jgi:hypothetical protein
MSAGFVGTLPGASLRRSAARIPMQRNHFGLGFTRHDVLPLPRFFGDDGLTAQTLRDSHGTTLQ